MTLPAGLVCCSISGDCTAILSAGINTLPASIDVIEIRLDTLKEKEVDSWLTACSRPLLFTNRPVWEGGMYEGDEEERLRPLYQAIQANAAYIDIELATNTSLRTPLIAAAESSLTRTIVSNHDFSATPGSHALDETLKKMMDSGADIGKIVTTAHTQTDVLRVLALLETAAEQGFPLSAFCMGEVGRISRFACCYLGGYMTYVAVNEKLATAPGQFSAETFQQLTTLFSADAD